MAIHGEAGGRPRTPYTPGPILTGESLERAARCREAAEELEAAGDSRMAAFFRADAARAEAEAEYYRGLRERG